MILYNSIVTSCLYRGEPDKAEEYLKNLGAIHSADYITSLKNLAVAYEKRGDLGEAVSIRGYIERIK